MMEWRDIESAPIGREMFVVRGFSVEGVASGLYTTDPYCVWRDGDTFARWPHQFPPTHWMPIPEPPL